MLRSRNLVTAALFLLLLKGVSVYAGFPPIVVGASEILIGLLVIIAFLQAGRRSERFGRQFWYLLSTSFIAWTLAHLPIVYRRDILGISTASNYWSVVILFFLFGLPFAIAFFLKEDREGGVIHWQETLDFAQVGVLVLALFLAFVYVPFLVDPSRKEFMDRSLLWHEARDGVLVLAFGWRSVISTSAQVRYVFRRMTIYLVLYGAGAILFYYGQSNWGTAGAQFADWVSDAVRVFAILLAVTSKEPPKEAAERRTDATTSWMLWVQVALFPILVLVMVPRIVAEDVAVGALLVTVSVACVCGRLFVTQQAVRKATDGLRASGARFRKLAEGISESSGETLFRSLVLHGAEATGATYALIGELKPGTTDIIRTIAMCANGEIVPNCEYQLAGTPCENAFGKQLCHFPNHVANLFPEDVLLTEMHVDAYIGSPLFRSSGAPVGIFVVMRDQPFDEPELAKSIVQICAARAATELERELDAENLRQSEQKLSLAFQLSPSPMLFGEWGEFDVEVNGQKEKAKMRLHSVSDSFVEFYGIPREKIIGFSPRELGLAATKEQLGELISSVEKKGSFHDIELVGFNSRGEPRTVLASGQLVSIGKEQFLLATFHDVTFERSAKTKLEENEKKYRDLFENADDFIFTLDFSGRFLATNRVGRKLCGYSTEEVQSHRLEELLDDSSTIELRRHLEQVINDSKGEMFEVKLKNQDAVSVLEVSLQLITEDGVPGFVQGIARDVTERRMLEKKVVQSQRMEAVGTLAAGVAHDFNNLLTVISGYSELALQEAGTNSALCEEIEEIRQAAQRAAGLTNQLLAFSRKQVSQPQVLNLNDSVKSIEKMLRRLIGEDIRLESNLDSAGAMIWADPVQIDQIIMNLAANARDAMSKGGSLRFSTSNLRLKSRDTKLNLAEGEYAMLTVADSGKGMDESTISHIFEPFFTTKEVGKGTGLGLATVYGIVQQADGHIAVASEVGRGTTFTIYFHAARGRQKSKLAEMVESQRGTETILVVEDDAALRTLAQKVLDAAGYKVYATSGVEPAERLLSEAGSHIDLVVTDVVMADGGGVALASWIAATHPNIKILFMSGYTDGKIPDEYLAAEHSSFLAKPFQPVQLARKVREVLDWKAKAGSETPTSKMAASTGGQTEL